MSILVCDQTTGDLFKQALASCTRSHLTVSQEHWGKDARSWLQDEASKSFSQKNRSDCVCCWLSSRIVRIWCSSFFPFMIDSACLFHPRSSTRDANQHTHVFSITRVSVTWGWCNHSLAMHVDNTPLALFCSGTKRALQTHRQRLTDTRWNGEEMKNNEACIDENHFLENKMFLTGVRVCSWLMRVWNITRVPSRIQYASAESTHADYLGSLLIKSSLSWEINSCLSHFDDYLSGWNFCSETAQPFLRKLPVQTKRCASEIR